jgi:AAA family ATP:ADP antiporter
MALPVDTSLLATPRRSPLERALCLFTDVRPGEGLTAVVMVANVFLILCAYYFVKPLRDGWIAIADIGGFSNVEVKAYTSFAQGLFLAGAVSLYAHLAGRWPRRQLIVRSTLFCISNLVVFWILRPGFLGQQMSGVGVAFYIWVGMFGVFVVAQFWAFAADLYPDERGERLVPLIAIGATSGAVAGSFLTGALLGSGVIESSALLLVAILPLIGSMLLTRLADVRGPVGVGAGQATARPAAAPSRGRPAGALALVVRHRYLLAVAGVTLFTAWVQTNGENLLFKVVQDSLAGELVARGVTNTVEMKTFVREWTTAFYGSFFFWVNVGALVLRALSHRACSNASGFGLILLLLAGPLPSSPIQSWPSMPILLVVRVMKLSGELHRLLSQQPARQVLWLRPPRNEVQGQTGHRDIFVRVGDGAARCHDAGRRPFLPSPRSRT